MLRGRNLSESDDINKIPHIAILDRDGGSIRPFANIERWFSKEALLGTSIAVEFGMKQEGVRSRSCSFSAVG